MRYSTRVMDERHKNRSDGESPPYLVQLTHRLATDLLAWPGDARESLAGRVLGFRDASGGFAGRAGSADLYYTAFALRTLTLLGELNAAIKEQASSFLRGRVTKLDNLIDIVSYLFCSRIIALPQSLYEDQSRGGCAAPNEHGKEGEQGISGADMSSEPDAAKRSSPQAADRENSHAGSNAPEVAAEPLAQQVEQFRSEDGGYAKGVGGTSSTYHTFLAGHAYDLLGLMMPQTDRLPAFLRTRQREDGGFAELARTPHSSVNPTCAAVALAVASGAAQADAIARAAGFLLQSQRADGGWPAGQASPASDLLSTFTAALTLRDMGLLTETNIRAMRQFVSGCRLPSGLYGSSIGDSEDDVEYAFYGLGCEALLLECDREITSA